MSGFPLSFISCSSAVVIFTLSLAINCGHLDHNNHNNLNPNNHTPAVQTTGQFHDVQGIQCGNNYNTYPMDAGTVSCTNYGAAQYECEANSCYVGKDPKNLASRELYFSDCARLGVEELLPRIMAVRYKAANLIGALEIMDENGQEYGCRWKKPNENGNVRVSCKRCRIHHFETPLKPPILDLQPPSATGS